MGRGIMEMVEPPKTIRLFLNSNRWSHAEEYRGQLHCTHATEQKYAGITFSLPWLLFVVYSLWLHFDRIQALALALVPANQIERHKTVFSTISWPNRFDHFVERLALVSSSIEVWIEHTMCARPAQHARNYNVILIVSFSKNPFAASASASHYVFVFQFN